MISLPLILLITQRKVLNIFHAHQLSINSQTNYKNVVIWFWFISLISITSTRDKKQRRICSLSVWETQYFENLNIYIQSLENLFNMWFLLLNASLRNTHTVELIPYDFEYSRKDDESGKLIN